MALTALKRKRSLSTLHNKLAKRRVERVFDVARLEAALRLTVPTIDSEEAARRALQGATRGRKGQVLVLQSSGSSGPRQLRVDIPSFMTADWQIARNWLMKWLPHIRSYDGSSPERRREIRDEINAAVAAAGGLEVFVGPEGFEFASQDLTTTFNVAVMAVIPFLVPEGWETSRLGQCRYRNCQRWFFRPPPRRGSVAEYCSPSHASTERVMRFRDKSRKAARRSK
jgi:hypothetical protein